MARRSEKGGPQFVEFFPVVLDVLRRLGGSARPAEVRDKVAEILAISLDEQSELLASGQPRFDNRVAWARFYLAKAGYIDSSRRGVWTLTDLGRLANKSHDEWLDIFKATHAAFSAEADQQASLRKALTEETVAPEVESGEVGHGARLMEILSALSASGFERFCQRLLRESGFQDVTVTGRTGDGGIDGIGILRVNPLVSFKVLFQCKRYSGSVSPSQVRDFRGAMQGRADKGIVITTGSFTTEAKKEAVRDGVPPIELVDGDTLLEMLESLELGLIPARTFRVDDRFFDEYREKP